MSGETPDERAVRRPAASPLTLGEGAVVAGRYELGPLISAGGQGAVYEAFDRRSERTRAVKVLLGHHLRDPKIVERFQREALLTAKIESEHLVEVLDAGADERTAVPFIVMERLRGEDLGCLLERRGPIPAAEVLVLLRQAALAIDKAHRHGILHRDLKPENLFVTRRDDGTPRLRVLDFGIAKLLDGTSAPNTQVIGTPMYMAPEQLKSEMRLTPAVDVFALGQIAFALLVGKPYWHEESSLPIHAFLVQLLQGARETVAARAARLGTPVSGSFQAWMARACAEQPDDRFASAGAAVEALEIALGSADVDVLDLGDDATQLAVDGRTSALDLAGRTAESPPPGPLPSLFDPVASSEAPTVLATGGEEGEAAPHRPTLVTPVVRPTRRATTTSGLASAALPAIPMHRGWTAPATWVALGLLVCGSLIVGVRHVVRFGAAPASSTLAAVTVEPAPPVVVPVRSADGARPPAIEARPEPAPSVDARSPVPALKPRASPAAAPREASSAKPSAPVAPPVAPSSAAPPGAPTYSIE